MKRKCQKCHMIRAVKDLVLLEANNEQNKTDEDHSKYICFSCWNKYFKEKKSRS